MSSWLDSVQAGKYSDSTSLPQEETQNTQNTQDQDRLIRFIRFIPWVEANNTDFTVVWNFVDLVRATTACDHQRFIDADIILSALYADHIKYLDVIVRNDTPFWP